MRSAEERYKAIEAARRKAQVRPVECVHRGPAKRREHKSCCGEVEIFDCAKRGQEVWHIFCAKCETQTTALEVAEAAEEPPLEETSLSVIPVIPTFNEGDRLEETLRHLICGGAVRHIVIVDDMGTDGSVRRCMRAWEWDRFERNNKISLKRNVQIHVFREGKLGVGGARQLGGTEAFKLGASTAFFMDSHVAIDSHDVIGVAEVAEREQAIVQPCCLGWNISGTARRYGGNLGWHERRILGVGYIKRRPPADDPRWYTPSLLKVKGLIGANGYAIPRTVWDRIGGWSTECGIWGFNEQLISSKAFFCDVPLLCDTSKTSRHYFKSSKKGEGVKVGMSAYWYSRWAVLRYLFCDKTWRKVWLPLLLERFSNTTLYESMSNPALLAARDKFLPLRNRTELEFFEHFLPHHREVWEGKL